MESNVEMLILVNMNDEVIHYREKEYCHLIPVPLHRAFSIFIVTTNGRMLIQKRQITKKTWPLFWSNACCSHPRKGESLSDAAARRLREELGITCAIRPLFTFHYRADYDETYGENELDHVLLGRYDGEIEPNNDEIEECKFMDMDELTNDVRNNPAKYTPWFKKCLPRVVTCV